MQVCDAFQQAAVVKALQQKHPNTTCSSCSEVVLVQVRQLVLNPRAWTVQASTCMCVCVQLRM